MPGGERMDDEQAARARAMREERKNPDLIDPEEFAKDLIEALDRRVSTERPVESPKPSAAPIAPELSLHKTKIDRALEDFESLMRQPGARQHDVQGWVVRGLSSEEVEQFEQKRAERYERSAAAPLGDSYRRLSQSVPAPRAASGPAEFEAIPVSPMRQEQEHKRTRRRETGKRVIDDAIEKSGENGGNGNGSRKEIEVSVLREDGFVDTDLLRRQRPDGFIANIPFWTGPDKKAYVPHRGSLTAVAHGDSEMFPNPLNQDLPRIKRFWDESTLDFVADDPLVPEERAARGRVEPRQRETGERIRSAGSFHQVQEEVDQEHTEARRRIASMQRKARSVQEQREMSEAEISWLRNVQLPQDDEEAVGQMFPERQGSAEASQRFGPRERAIVQGPPAGEIAPSIPYWIDRERKLAYTKSEHGNPERFVHGGSVRFKNPETGGKEVRYWDSKKFSFSAAEPLSQAAQEMRAQEAQPRERRGRLSDHEYQFSPARHEPVSDPHAYALGERISKANEMAHGVTADLAKALIEGEPVAQRSGIDIPQAVKNQIRTLATSDAAKFHEVSRLFDDIKMSEHISRELKARIEASTKRHGISADTFLNIQRLQNPKLRGRELRREIRSKFPFWKKALSFFTLGMFGLISSGSAARALHWENRSHLDRFQSVERDIEAKKKTLKRSLWSRIAGRIFSRAA